MKLSASLPLRTVSANVLLREHWSKRSKMAAEHRNLIKLALRGAQSRAGVVLRPTIHGWEAREAFYPSVAGFLPRWVKFNTWMVILTRVSPGRLDLDNLQGAMKFLRDGVADFLEVDDADPRVVWTYEQRRAKGYGVEVTVEAG